jgi:hypothetical protein
MKFFMPLFPICPNCGDRMKLKRILPSVIPSTDHQVFHCSPCNLDYLTRDYLPIAGPDTL